MMQKKYVYADEKAHNIQRYGVYIGKSARDLSVDSPCRKFSVSKAQLYKPKPYMPDGIAEFIKSARLAKACASCWKKPINRLCVWRRKAAF